MYTPLSLAGGRVVLSSIFLSQLHANHPRARSRLSRVHLPASTLPRLFLVPESLTRVASIRPNVLHARNDVTTAFPWAVATLEEKKKWDHD